MAADIHDLLERMDGGNPGMLEAGNIDLTHRPRVKNPAGGTSTVYSASFNFDGKEYLLPKVAAGVDHILSDDEAVARFQKTGEHLGVFRDAESATRYAKQLHEDQEAGRMPPPVQPIVPQHPMQERPDATRVAPAKRK